MIVKDILEKDLKACAKLHKKSFSKEWSEEEFKSLYDNPHISGLYLLDNENMVGFILYLHILDDAEIYTLCICPNERQKGYASELLEALKIRLSTRCVSRIFLEVSENNVAAQKLYQKNDYQIFDKRKNYYIENNQPYDAFLMQYIF